MTGHPLARLKHHAYARCFGALATLALTVLLGALGGYAVLATGDNGYGLIFVGMLAVVIGLPLLALAIGITAYLIAKGAAGKVMLMWMWLPVLAAGAIFPLHLAIDSIGKSRFESAYPLIEEVHVNLSGLDVWTDPAAGRIIQMQAQSPQTFYAHAHWPGTSLEDDRREAYAGSQLAATFNTIKVFGADPAGATPVVKPVLAMPLPAAWAPFANKLRSSLAERIVYLYYYYPDRVEVTRAMRWDASDSGKTPDGEPIVDFYLHNLGARHIARLEINDQPVASEDTRAPLEEPNCRTYPVQASARAGQALKLRWQYAQANPPWHEATLNLPAFRHEHPQKGRPGREEVDVFFKADASAAAQRLQQLTLGLDTLAIRYTDPALVSAAAPACGTASNRYGGDIERVPD